jgi:hypothetical protein
VHGLGLRSSECRSVVSVRTYSADGLTKGRRASFIFVEFAPRSRRQPLPDPVRMR